MTQNWVDAYRQAIEDDVFKEWQYHVFCCQLFDVMMDHVRKIEQTYTPRSWGIDKAFFNFVRSFFYEHPELLHAIQYPNIRDTIQQHIATFFIAVLFDGTLPSVSDRGLDKAWRIYNTPINMCPHNKKRHRCIHCNESLRCVHNMYKKSCRYCSPHLFCVHAKPRTVCPTCRVHRTANEFYLDT